MNMDVIFWKNSILAWAIFLASSFALWVLLIFVRKQILRALPILEARGKGVKLLHFIEIVCGALRPWTLFIFALFFASQHLEMTPTAQKWVGRVSVFTLLLQIGMILDGFIVYGRREKSGIFSKSPITLGLISFIARTVVWVTIALLMLDNVGVKITALVAGLGVGGVAIALAVQNILGDLFASMTIALDQPFEVGDFIVVGEFMGTVERVGLKTTRIRSLSGEELIFSNGDLLQSRLRNFKRMTERRSEIKISVPYTTESNKIPRINEIIKGAVEKQKSARFERVHLKMLGPTALEFELVYWVLSSKYIPYMDTQQAILLDVITEFEKAEIYFSMLPHVSSKMEAKPG